MPRYMYVPSYLGLQRHSLPKTFLQDFCVEMVNIKTVVRFSVFSYTAKNI